MQSNAGGKNEFELEKQLGKLTFVGNTYSKGFFFSVRVGCDVEADMLLFLLKFKTKQKLAQVGLLGNEAVGIDAGVDGNVAGGSVGNIGSSTTAAGADEGLITTTATVTSIKTDAAESGYQAANGKNGGSGSGIVDGSTVEGHLGPATAAAAPASDGAEVEGRTLYSFDVAGRPSLDSAAGSVAMSLVVVPKRSSVSPPGSLVDASRGGTIDVGVGGKLVREFEVGEKGRNVSSTKAVDHDEAASMYAGSAVETSMGVRDGDGEEEGEGLASTRPPRFGGLTGGPTGVLCVARVLFAGVVFFGCVRFVCFTASVVFGGGTWFRHFPVKGSGGSRCVARGFCSQGTMSSYPLTSLIPCPIVARKGIAVPPSLALPSPQLIAYMKLLGVRLRLK